MDGRAVEATGIEKSYGSVHVLVGVDLRVASGSVFAVLGPNGAGQTTMVRILSTLTRADAGRASVAGFDVVRDRRQVRHRISLTGQYAALDELQTGVENLRMMGSLVGQPSVVFLDEPTTGLDLRSRQAMWQIITELAGSGATVFLTTQYLEEADRLADHVAVLDGGRIVADGTASELKQRVAEQRLDLVFNDPAGFDDAVRALGVRALSRDPDRLSVSVATDGGATHVRSVLDELDPLSRNVSRFTVHTATLDDVFLTLTGRTATRPEKETAGV